MDIAAEKIVTRQTSTHRFGCLFSDALKRVFDILLSALGLFLLSPFFLLIGLAIRRDSNGPVFYHGLRKGCAGREFHILKFRTMYETPESYQGPRVTAQDDPRVTPVGRWLRQTKLNELPQLWNVLKGEMSLVGPRPEDPQLAALWPEEARREVLSVRPGITSPASVLWRDEEVKLNGRPAVKTYIESIMPSKLRLDQLYARHHNIWLDLDILLWTGLVLLPRLGSYKPPEDALFAGPFSRIMRRLLSWYVVDTLITLASLGFVGILWRSFGPFTVGWLFSIGLALSFSFLFSLCGALFGTHRVSWSKATFGELLNLLGAAVLATILTLLLNSYLGSLRTPPSPLYPPSMLVTAAALSNVGFVFVRYRSQLVAGLARRWLVSGNGARAAQERVLIIGGGEAGQFAAWLLTNGRSAGLFNVVGFVDDDLYKQGLRIGGLRVIGHRANIPELVVENDVGILVFAIHNIAPSERQRLLEICTSACPRVVLMPDILGALNQISRHDPPLNYQIIAPSWEIDPFFETGQHDKPAQDWIKES